jgi:hypothetical protein
MLACLPALGALLLVLADSTDALSLAVPRVLLVEFVAANAVSLGGGNRRYAFAVLDAIDSAGYAPKVSNVTARPIAASMIYLHLRRDRSVMLFPDEPVNLDDSSTQCHRSVAIAIRAPKNVARPIKLRIRARYFRVLNYRRRSIRPAR